MIERKRKAEMEKREKDNRNKIERESKRRE